MKKQHQVFISSTFEDLREERIEVMTTLLRLKCMPASMELFPPTTETTWEFIQQVIDASDYYIIIVAGKYGSVHPEYDISFTKMEYDYAKLKKKPILRFIRENLEILPQSKIEKDKKREKKLKSFRDELQRNNVCSLFTDPKDLSLKVYHGIKELMERFPEHGSFRFDPIEFDDVKKIKEKLAYYKMINLQSVHESPDTIYEKYIPRLDKKIKVSSEYMCIRIVKFDDFVKRYKGRNRTNGDAIEVQSLFPFQILVDDSDRWASIIEPVIDYPSNIYITSTHSYNGFKTGNLDLGLKVEKDTELVRLIVDFSSIPGLQTILSHSPKLLYTQHLDGKMTTSELTEYEIVAPGIFLAELADMKKDEALRFEFFTNSEA